MAARNQKIRHDEETRAKIQTTQLLNRLQDHAFNKCEMTPTQVRAAEICLRKTIPDLAMTEIAAEVIHRFAQVPQVMSKEDWLRTRGDPKLLELSSEPRPRDRSDADGGRYTANSTEHAPQTGARREDKPHVAPPVAKDPNSKLN